MRTIYLAELDRFESAHDFACRVSEKSGGYIVDQRTGWAQWVHLRMCILGQTMRDIAGVARSMSEKRDKTLDLIGAASIARSMLEANLMFNYISEDVSADEWEAKFLGLCIHDAIFRRRAFEIFNKEDKDLHEAERRQIEELRADISKNFHFKKIDKDMRDAALSGRSPFLISRRRLAERSGWDWNVFEHVFAYLSNYAHASTGSFIRTEMHGVDFQKPTEMQYAGVVYSMGICAKLLLQASERISAVLG